MIGVTGRSWEQKKTNRNLIEKLNSKSKIIHLPALKEGDMTPRMHDNSKMLMIIQNDLISLDQGLDLMLEHPDYKS